MELNVQGRAAYAYTGGKPFDGARPAVVFIHGASNDHSPWTLLARWCAHHGYAPLAVDLPGHGRSAGPPLDSIEALADWVLALLDAAGARQAALVGHSMGSLIALEAAARAPARASALVMMGTAYPMKVSAALLETAQADPLKAMQMVNAWSFRSIASKPSFLGPGMWLHGSAMALMRRMQTGEPSCNLFHHDFSVCDRYEAGEAAADKVTCPVTFVLGRDDAMTPTRAARDLGARLKARVVVVTSGHHLIAEAPDAVLDALRAALPPPVAAVA